MEDILIMFLRVVLVVNSAFLLLLILIQLPKKESGSGLAFGGGTLDVALGAGAGNVLTKATKWSAAIFLGLCLILAVVGNPNGGGLRESLANQPAPATLPAPLAPTIPSGQSPSFNTIPAAAGAGATNAPAQAEIETAVPEEISGAADPVNPTSPVPLAGAAAAQPPSPAPAPPEKPAEKPGEQK